MTKARKIRIGGLGIGGRMGSEIERLLAKPRFSERAERGAFPRKGESLEALFAADVWIEFSSPAGALALAREAVRRRSKTPLVVGATGWSAGDLAELEEAAKAFPILRSANFAVGVRLCRMALESWRGFPELSNWRVSIREFHHAGKKDAPSGTALSLREALGSELGRNAAIASVREGDIVGIHEIVLESDSEKLTLVHEAKDRAVFAEGALEAAIRLAEADLARLPKRLLGLDDLYLHRGA